MRYSQEHKQASRERIVGAAARLFRGRGYHATGVDDVVRAACLTPGAFYRHFPSKAALLSEALQQAAADAMRRTNEGLERLRGERWLRRFVARYLDADHARDVADGCPVAALAAELAKGSDDERRALDEAVAAMVEGIAAQLGGTRRDRARAWEVLASCVGTLVLARAVRDPREAARLLERGRASALAAGAPKAARRARR